MKKTAADLVAELGWLPLPACKPPAVSCHTGLPACAGWPAGRAPSWARCCAGLRTPQLAPSARDRRRPSEHMLDCRRRWVRPRVLAAAAPAGRVPRTHWCACASALAPAAVSCTFRFDSGQTRKKEPKRTDQNRKTET